MNLKDALDIGLDIGTAGLDWSNWRNMTRLGGLFQGGASSLFGKKGTPKEEAGAQAVEENRMQEGELQAILGWLCTLEDSSGNRVVDYRVKPDESNYVPGIIKEMKPGAGRLLLKTLGAETVLVKKRRVTGYTEHEVDGKMKQTPVTEETVEKVNLSGQQLSRALTWLVAQESGNENEKIKKVVSVLESFGAFTSKLDAAKALGAKSAEQLKQFSDWFKTHAPVFGAIMVLGQEEVEGLVQSPAVQRLLAEIKSAEKNPDLKRELQARFEAILIQASERHVKRKVKEYKTFRAKYWRITALVLLAMMVFILAMEHRNELYLIFHR